MLVKGISNRFLVMLKNKSECILKDLQEKQRVQILLPATRGICAWLPQIQLLRALLIFNWSASRQLGFLTSFCSIYNTFYIFPDPQLVQKY